MRIIMNILKIYMLMVLLITLGTFATWPLWAGGVLWYSLDSKPVHKAQCERTSQLPEYYGLDDMSVLSDTESARADQLRNF